MKLKNYRLLFVMTFLIFNSCKPASKMRITATWIDKEKTSQLQKKEGKVFVAVLTQNSEVRQTLEGDLAEACKAKGLEAIQSIEVYPPVTDMQKYPPADKVLDWVRKLGCDAIFTVALVDMKSETYYVPGAGDYIPNTHYGYYTFGPYYGYATVAVYAPGYYESDHTYFLESNLYDAKTESLVMTMQTKLMNPESVEKESKKYTKTLVQELDHHGLLKSRK
jgi:hypothetical protein